MRYPIENIVFFLIQEGEDESAVADLHGRRSRLHATLPENAGTNVARELLKTYQFFYCPPQADTKSMPHSIHLRDNDHVVVATMANATANRDSGKSIRHSMQTSPARDVFSKCRNSRVDSFVKTMQEPCGRQQSCNAQNRVSTHRLRDLLGSGSENSPLSNLTSNQQDHYIHNLASLISLPKDKQFPNFASNSVRFRHVEFQSTHDVDAKALPAIPLTKPLPNLPGSPVVAPKPRDTTRLHPRQYKPLPQKPAQHFMPTTRAEMLHEIMFPAKQRDARASIKAESKATFLMETRWQRQHEIGTRAVLKVQDAMQWLKTRPARTLNRIQERRHAWNAEKSEMLEKRIQHWKTMVASGSAKADVAMKKCAEEMRELYLGKGKYRQLCGEIDKWIMLAKSHQITFDEARQHCSESLRSSGISRQHLNEARYYQLLNGIADSFAGEVKRDEDIRNEPDPQIRAQLQERRAACYRWRGEWQKGQLAPDMSPDELEGLTIAEKAIAKGTEGSIDILVNKHGKRMAGKTPAADYECSIARRIYNNMRGVWHPNLIMSWGTSPPESTRLNRSHYLMEEITTKKDGSDVLVWMLQASDKNINLKQEKAWHNAPADHGITRRELDGVLQFLEVRALSVCSYLHEAGFAYNDLKVNNLMIDKTGEPIFLDLGAAAELGETLHIATPNYSAPEILGSEMRRQRILTLDKMDDQPFGKGTDKSDVYTVGGMAYQYIRYQPPFNSGRPSPIFGTGNAQEHFLYNLMRRDPQKRLGVIGATMEEYLADRILTDSEARAVLRKVMDMMDGTHTQDPRKAHVIALREQYNNAIRRPSNEPGRKSLRELLNKPGLSKSDVEQLVDYMNKCVAVRERIEKTDDQLKSSALSDLEKVLNAKIKNIDLTVQKIMSVIVQDAMLQLRSLTAPKSLEAVQNALSALTNSSDSSARPSTRNVKAARIQLEKIRKFVHQAESMRRSPIFRFPLPAQANGQAGLECQKIEDLKPELFKRLTEARQLEEDLSNALGMRSMSSASASMTIDQQKPLPPLPT